MPKTIGSSRLRLLQALADTIGSRRTCPQARFFSEASASSSSFAGRHVYIGVQTLDALSNSTAQTQTPSRGHFSLLCPCPPRDTNANTRDDMAACVDKWHPTHPGRLSASSIYRYPPDCTTDRPMPAATPPASRGGGAWSVTSSDDEVWDELRAEAHADAESEPLLRKFYADLVLSRPSLESALAAHLSSKLCVPGALPQDALRDLIAGALASHPEAGRAARADLLAARDRDPACERMVHCFLYYKGFLALQAHRAAHGLWADGRRAAALLLQSRASEVFGVDIHPGARIGQGVLFDHATGVVIGETAVVGNDVSILHGVTLGGTGKESGDRHPKVGDGVLIGAGASVLGNVHIGAGAKIGAGAVVLRDVAEGTTAVGNPARDIGKKAAPQRRPEEQPGVTMEQRWSNYVI